MRNNPPLPGLENLNVISDEQLLISPRQLKKRLPVPAPTAASVMGARRAICDILDRRDPRFMIIVGPCSIHDPDAAMDYGGRLAELAKKLCPSLLLVMRVYFEKPRTTTGWKGLINDPHLDETFDINEGLRIARRLLLDLAALGLPLGTEALDPVVPQYIQDLIAWSAIGARTTESQKHRELASGLSSPVGFKNGTDGSIDIAINALQSAAHPHRFLGIDDRGRAAIIETKGNSYGHIVLRGGGGKPNYGRWAVEDCEKRLARSGLPDNVVIDCSHANSGKNHDRQPGVLDEVAKQIEMGNTSIIGAMLESNLLAGRQDIPAHGRPKNYGVSITDACIDWPTTERILTDLATRLDQVLHRRGRSVLKAGTE